MKNANCREWMARRIQDAGGSWLGRSEATETAKADERCARFVGPDGAARRLPGAGSDRGEERLLFRHPAPERLLISGG